MDSREPLRLLLIDDDEVDRLAVRRALREIRAEWTEAHDGAGGLNALRAQPFDCALLDLRLPDIHGMEVLEKARASGCTTPVVILTGQGDPKTAVALMKAGAMDFVFKERLGGPDLHQAVFQAIRAHRAEMAVRRERLALQLLADVGERLAGSREQVQTLNAVAQLIARDLADGCVIDLAGSTGFERVAVALRRTDPAQEARIRAFPPRAPRHPASEVLSNGRGVVLDQVADLLPDLTSSPEHLELVRAMGLRCTATVALRAAERTLGAITMVRLEGSAPFDAHDLNLLEQVAARVGLSVENLRLFDEMRQARKAAEEATRMREELLAIVSHDLRNPLTAVVTTAEVLRRKLPPEGRERRHVETVLRAAGQMRRLIEDLLDLARIQAGQLHIHPEPQELNHLLDQATELFTPIASNKGLSLQLQRPSGPIPLVVDPPRLMQVLSNLVGNAVKFTPEGGQITVSGEPSDRDVVFGVSDTGPGIPPEQVDRIFDRYFQADRANQSREGLGLGLSIARGIVEAHGGRIWAESEPGRGTRVFFTVPRPPASAR